MDVIERESQLFFHTYKRLSLEVERGEGCYLFTKDGKKYLDMFSGLAVNALGYTHPAVINAIEAQAKKYTHLSNYFIQAPQLALAERILHFSGFKKLFFSNSGTEAIEGTIKLVRKWGTTCGKKDIFGMSNGFSGRTMGALSIMDKEKYREGYGPFLANCGSIEFNNVADLTSKVNNDTAGVFLEFVQGEGGIVPATKEFIHVLTDLQKQFGFLIVADEIQSGVGRTGKFFAYQHYEVSPDIVTIAKPIGGGLPLGAILGSEKVADVLTYGVHGTTFGGNPVACAAGIAVLDNVMKPEMVKAIIAESNSFFATINELKKKFPIIKEVRGYGYMIGIDLSTESVTIVNEMLDRGVLVNSTAGSVIRILPPLIARHEEFTILANTLEDVLAKHG